MQSEEEVTQINKHILALLYRTLRFKMQHDDSLRVRVSRLSFYWLSQPLMYTSLRASACAEDVAWQNISCPADFVAKTLWTVVSHVSSLPLRCVQGVLQAHPLSAAAQTLVEGALGDMHGSFTESTYPENVNTLSQNSISIGGMSLSIHGLSTRRNRCAGGV